MELNKVLKGLTITCQACDWTQDIKPDDMEHYLGVACPECEDTPLLTQEELDHFKATVAAIEAFPEELMERFGIDYNSEKSMSVLVVAGRGEEDRVEVLKDEVV